MVRNAGAVPSMVCGSVQGIPRFDGGCAAAREMRLARGLLGFARVNTA